MTKPKKATPAKRAAATPAKRLGTKKLAARKKPAKQLGAKRRPTKQPAVPASVGLVLSSPESTGMPARRTNPGAAISERRSRSGNLPRQWLARRSRME